MENKNYLEGIIEMVKHPIVTFRLYRAGSELIKKEQFWKKLYGDKNGKRVWREVALKPAFGEKSDYKSIEDVLLK